MKCKYFPPVHRLRCIFRLCVFGDTNSRQPSGQPLPPAHLVYPYGLHQHQTCLGPHHSRLDRSGGLDFRHLPPLHQPGLPHRLEQDTGDQGGAEDPAGSREPEVTESLSQ